MHFVIANNKLIVVQNSLVKRCENPVCSNALFGRSRQFIAFILLLFFFLNTAVDSPCIFFYLEKSNWLIFVLSNSCLHDVLVYKNNAFACQPYAEHVIWTTSCNITWPFNIRTYVGLLLNVTKPYLMRYNIVLVLCCSWSTKLITDQPDHFKGTTSKKPI